MAESLSEPKSLTRMTIEELLEERQQLWALYINLSGMQPFKAGQALEDQIREFCQLLVDYISLGHFELYERFNDGSEQREEVQAVAREVYPQFAEATDMAIEFNDRYDTLKGEELRDVLADDLSRLGEFLVLRTELEDRLIEAMES